MNLSTSSSPPSLPLPPLIGPDGAELSSQEVEKQLRGRQVALYFAAGWCPMCTSFEPSLIKFREAAAGSGNPVELLYVGSDRSDADQLGRAAGMGMSSVPFENVAEVKKHFRIWAGSECRTFGGDRRSGVPALVVLDKSGRELAFVPAEARGVRSLESWPLQDKNAVWGS